MGENAGQAVRGRQFHTEGPIFKKALFCSVEARACGTKQSCLGAEQGYRWPQQD